LCYKPQTDEYKVKRILVIAILISYSIASFGVNLNYFYCCGKLKTVSLVVNTEERYCKSKSTKSCCDNKTVTIKLKTDQKNSDQTTIHLTAQLSPSILHKDNYTVTDIASNGNINPLYKSPPTDNLPSRQVLFCVFRL
jgi:hypothetical protein